MYMYIYIMTTSIYTYSYFYFKLFGPLKSINFKSIQYYNINIYIIIEMLMALMEKIENSEKKRNKRTEPLI